MFRCLQITLREFVQSVYVFGKHERRYMLDVSTIAVHILSKVNITV